MMLSYHYAIEFAKEQKEVFGGDMNAFLDVAIECIEKQIPKPPIVNNYRPSCPICGKLLAIGCRCINNECGQHILWEDEE